ncbi:hypothetical protein [Chamaesiphon sp. VAR_48_metabat_135_sub]|uniref:hypothetical protein n=1 Tax=Chamaesiphon sp. VAR_48_metabat_135_sub TaxID=2964699 RepID=UPI00286BD354|nr:hypothetical protein [Chamaesiphon sp. VAR_48_metabat_135_sub]
MGLLIIVGDLAEFLYNLDNTDEEEIEDYKEIYRSLDRFLLRCGLPGHKKPESVELPYRGESDNFSYSSIHYLRRAYVHMCKGFEVIPFDGEYASKDRLLAAEYDSPSIYSHLVYHSDCEGFYVPVNFPSPLIPAVEDDVLGGIVGSSYCLLRELVSVAPFLDIQLEGGDLSEYMLKKLLIDRERDCHPFKIERMVWFTLFECARKSIEYKTAIRFG